MVMGVNFCPNCGQRVKRVANFCPKCGVKLATMIADSKEPLEGVEPEYLLQSDAETLTQKEDNADQEDAPAENDSDESRQAEQCENFFGDDGENFPHLKRRAPNEIAQAAKTQQDHVSIPSVGLAAALAAVAGGAASAVNAATSEFSTAQTATQKEESAPVSESISPINQSQPAELTSKKNAAEPTSSLVAGPVGAWEEAAPTNDDAQQGAPSQTEEKAGAQPASVQGKIAAEISEQDASPKDDATVLPALSADDGLTAARAELAKAEAELAKAQEQSNNPVKTTEAVSSNTAAAILTGAAVVGYAAINSTEKNERQKANLSAASSPNAKRSDNKELIKLEPVPTGADSTAVDEENSTPIGSDGEVAAPKKISAPASTDGQGGNKNFIAVIILLAIIAAAAVYWQMNF